MSCDRTATMNCSIFYRPHRSCGKVPKMHWTSPYRDSSPLDMEPHHKGTPWSHPPPPDIGPHSTETPWSWPPSDIWWQDWRPVQTCSLEDPPLHWCGHLVATEARTFGKWVVSIPLECFLVGVL